MDDRDWLHLQGKTIAFSHYSAKNDISGVTTWLERLILRLHRDQVPVRVLLHHLDKDVKESSLMNTLLEAGVPVDIEIEPQYTEDRVLSTLCFLNRHQPRVFLPQCMESMYYAAKIAGNSGLAWAMTLHSDDPIYWALADTVRPETNGGLIVGVSNYICQKLIEQNLADHPHNIPYGVPSLDCTTSFSDAPFRVAFSGRVVEEQKRFSLVLATMAQACLMDSRIECLVIGDGPALSSSRQWVADNKLGNRIHFLGRLESSIVQNKLSQCQALLLMSDYEGLPVTLLEAMAIGIVPVVRTIPSGIPELVKHHETGLLVDDTPEQAAAAIVCLAARPDLWFQCSKAAKSLIAQNYSEYMCYQRWLDVISQLGNISTIQYPIPKKISLPPLHPAMTERDCRKPSLAQQVLAKLNYKKERLKQLPYKNNSALGKSKYD
jgi:colanic acid/amylovoran biosynthesis glycosyltransferase